MKKMNLLVMSLVSAAALSFTSCSDSEDLAGNAGQEKANDVYMTLSIQTPLADGTRTSQADRKNVTATTEEAEITNGTIYLYDGAKLVYSKAITASDWKHLPNQANNGRGTTNPVKIAVNGIEKGKTYKVYFLAGDKTSNTPTTDELTGAYTIGTEDPTSISLDLAKANSFVMFNQNDAQRQDGGEKATVKFDGDETYDDPAWCQMVYLDRVSARVDAPTADKAVFVKDGTGENEPATKNLDLVDNIAYQSYAISNLSNKTNIMQKWESEWAKFLIPTVEYTQNYATFGNKWNNNGSTKFFGKQNNYYILENCTNNIENATAIYLCYKATLKNTDGADFSDGTFYRYDYKIYTSLEQIKNDATVEWPFRKADGTIMTVDEAKALFSANGNLKGQDDLEAVRKTYGLDIYEKGIMYYRIALDDQSYTFKDKASYAILRNTVYKLNVKNIYDLGRDVPNGPTPDDKDKNYYMNCDIQVNPWVLSTQNVSLK